MVEGSIIVARAMAVSSLHVSFQDNLATRDSCLMIEVEIHRTCNERYHA